MATSSLLSRVIESQWQDAEIVSIRDRVQSGTGDEGWTVHSCLGQDCEASEGAMAALWSGGVNVGA